MDLTKYYPDIVAKYPAYVTKRELCEICHICPKTAYNLEQQGEIPYTIEQNHLIRSHKIKLTDILAYLYRRECRQEADSPYICAMRTFYDEHLSPYSDLLSVKDIQQITGFSSSAIVRWISTGILKAFQPGKQYTVPKDFMLDFLISPYYRRIRRKTPLQKELMDVKDIRGNFLYTRDNLALAYLKIYPISTELFSKNEKRLIAKQLTVSLSSAQYPFQLLAVSRPVDISPLLSELSATLTSSSDVKQKELLKQEIVEMGAFALSGEVVERQFYIKIWDRVSDGVERDLLQKLKLLGGYFSDSGIQTEILEQQDIVRLCNLVNNPAYVHLEDSGINAAIPILESVGVA